MTVFERERTSSEMIMYALYLYFLGLSFRNTSKAIQPLFEEKGRSHVAIWKWVLRFNPTIYTYKKFKGDIVVMMLKGTFHRPLMGRMRKANA